MFSNELVRDKLKTMREGVLPVSCLRFRPYPDIVIRQISTKLLIPYLPYILESNPPHFHSFRGLKKSDADYNRAQIRFTVVSWILEKL